MTTTINLTFFLRSLTSVAMLTDFWRESAIIVIPQLHSVPAFHNGREDRNMDVRVNTADNPATPGELCSSNPSFAGTYSRRRCQEPG